MNYDLYFATRAQGEIMGDVRLDALSRNQFEGVTLGDGRDE
ncbi:hypothetical protein KDK_51700 [Dictyobacter kobayashii]|uniref:Uncharacterized protein n=1 Tax=Dictyobacter kobayashii TaxID=2014872 RepID=A0A402AQN3_9CHLR|nr:hypothetical protein KDK_51700 [Dictyobacter kobayashii]